MGCVIIESGRLMSSARVSRILYSREELALQSSAKRFLTRSSTSVAVDESDERAAPHSGALGVLLDVLEVFLDEEGRQHVQLLDPQRRGPLLRLLLGQVGEQAGRLQEIVGLSVQLDRLDDLVFVQKVLRVLC